MIVFRTFLKVLKACKVPIIMYTVILVAFGGFNMQTSDSSANFVASKPDVYIVNNDDEKGITKGLIDYIDESCNIVDLKDDEEAIDDALFYRDVNYIIYIPEGFRQDFIDGKNPEIEVKSTGDYQASLAQLMIKRYIEVANVYNNSLDDEEVIVKKTRETMANTTEIQITSKLDTDNLAKAAYFFNFANYSILAGCVYVICLILSSFKEQNISKRTIVSSVNYKKYNRELLLANGLFAVVLWIFYIVLSFVLLGDIMFTKHGLVYIVNSFVFSLCALTLAFLIGNLFNNKEALNGIVNVIALGSSFLCGAFVPMEWLPDFVLKIAHILPSYWYIKNNELLRSVEEFNKDTMKPIAINMMVMVGFMVVFVIATNVVSGRKRRIG